MESTDISAANGNLAEYFVSYGGEENSELIMQAGSSSSEGCDQSGSIYISTPPDIRVEHVSVDKDGNLILETSSNTHDTTDSAQEYTSLPSTSQAENTFIAYKDGVEESKQLSLAESSATNSDEKIFLLQPNAAENVNVVLANAVNNNAELAALRQANENIVLNIITEDGQKLQNVILAQNVAEPLGVKPKPSLDPFPLPDSLGRNSQQSYSKPVTSGLSLEKTRGYSGRRKSGRGRGRGAYAPQPVFREFHMEKKLEMLSNFQELIMTSQSKTKPSSTAKLSASNSSRSDMVRAVNTDQNTIILTRSQPQQSLLHHPKISERPSTQTSNPTTETLSGNSTEIATSILVASQRMTRPPKTPKLVTTPVIMKTSELRGMSHKGLQQLVSMKAANAPQVSTRMNATTKTDPTKKASSQMSTIVVIVPPCSKWGTSAADIDAKEKPLLENPSIMFSQNSSSSRTMLYEIPAKIVKFQEDKPLQRKLPFRHQDYLKVTKIQNEGEPIRPPGRFYKSRGSKKSVQISIPVVEKLSDGKGTRIVNSVQQLMSMYPLLSTRLPQIAKLVDSSSMNIPQSILGTEAVKSEPRTSQEVNSDRSCSAMDIKSSLLPSLSSYQKLELQVADRKANIISKDVQYIGKQLKGNTAPDSALSFCHSNVLRTYQELRSISQKGRSCSPSKSLKQNCHLSSSQTCASSGIVVAEETSNIETVQVERQEECHNMESVLKGLEIASPDDSTRPAATSCTDETVLGAISRKESANDSVLPDPYLSKHHCQTAATSDTDVNLTDSTQHKEDDHNFQKEDDLQLLPHSQNENSIQHDQSSVNIESLLTPQTSLSMKYDVQTSIARNLSAGLKTLDLDSFLALSNDDDEVGRDGSLISKEVCQDTVSKHEELPVDHSPSKSEVVCRLTEHFPEGVLYIEEPASSVAPMEKLTEETSGSGVQLEESSGVTCDITQHTKELSGIVHDVSNNRNVILSSGALKNDIEHKALETNSVNASAIIGLNCQMLQTASTDSTQKLELLSYENAQETVLQMQDFSKVSNLENKNGSKLAARSPEQTEVSGYSTEAIEEPVKSSTSTKPDDDKKTTVSLEHKLDGQKTVFSHDVLDESNCLDISDTTSLQCSDKPNVTTSLNVPEIEKKTKGSIDTVLHSSSGAASWQATNANSVSSEQNVDEAHVSGALTMNISFQQPSENVGSDYKAKKTVTEKPVGICNSEQLLPSETYCNKGDNGVGESEDKLLPSEICDLTLTSEMGFRKSNAGNAKTCCLPSSEDGISELAEEKLQNTSSLSEVHFTKASNSSLLDEVTALQKQPALLETMLTCSEDETSTEMSTGVDKISVNTVVSNKSVTDTEHSSFNNGASVNLEMPPHYDKDAKSEEHFMKTDAPVSSFIMGDSYSKQVDNVRTEEEVSAYNVVDNAKLDAPLYTLSSPEDEKPLKVSTAFSAHQSPESEISKEEVLQPPFGPAHDPHTKETGIDSPASSDVDLNKTDDSAATRATDDQPEECNVAATSKCTDFVFHGEKEHGNAKTQSPDVQGIPVINSSTEEKIVRNGTLSCIGSSISSENFSNVAPNVGILTGLNVLATKEASSASMQGSNLSNINFINLLQASKKMNPAGGVSNSHLLGYANTVLLLPTINTQGSNVEFLNPGVTVSNVTEQSTALSSGNQIKTKDDTYTDLNENSKDNPQCVHESAKKTMEPLQKCEKVHYQMSGFVFADEEALSSLKGGQMILSEQTSKDTTNVSSGYALQSRTEKETEDPSECAPENSLFKVSNVDASSNISLNSSNVEPSHGNDKEAEIHTAQSTLKQVGRERRRRKQSLEELRLPEEFMKMEVLPLQELSPVKKRRRYRKRNRTLAVDVKKELESSDYCGDTVDVKLNKNESKETDKNGLTTADNLDLSMNLQEVSGNGENFSIEASSTSKLKDVSEEHLLISNKTGEMEGQHPQAGVTNNNAVKELSVEGESALPQKQLSLGSRDEDNKAKESDMKEEGISPQTPKLLDAKERGSHLKRRLFRQLSSADLQKEDEKKSKKILSKAKPLDHAFLSIEVAISDQHNSGEVDSSGSSSEFTVIKKSRGSHKKQSAEKIEEDVGNDCQKIPSSPRLEQAVQSKIPDSKKDVPEKLAAKQLSKIKVKGLKESIRRISRRASVKQDDTPGTSSKTASGKSSFPTEKKEQRTARIIRELRKRMTRQYRKQEDAAVSKKENFKTNGRKQKTETKTTSLIVTESQGKESSEQDKKKLRRSARQYIKKKIIKIRMSLRMKNQATDTALLSTRKRISSVEKLHKGVDSIMSQKRKTKGDPNDRKKCPDKVTRPKTDKRKKFSTSGRKGLQTQRSSSPEYPIAIPMPQDAPCDDETAEDCVHKENKDIQQITTLDDAKIIDDSEMIPISTDVIKECLPISADVREECLPICADVREECLPVSADTREECLPVSADTREECLPVSADTREECLPVSADTREECLPVSADMREECLPVSTDMREECLPVSADTREECLPVSADTREDCLPVSADTREECLPVSTDMREECLPVSADTREKCLPVSADIRKECLPVSADMREECLPLSTDIRKECLPVSTDMREECLPVSTDVGKVCLPVSADMREECVPVSTDVGKVCLPISADIRKECLPVSTDIGKVCLPISADIRKECLPVSTDIGKVCLPISADIRKECLPVSTDIGKVCLPISADIRKEHLPISTDIGKVCLPISTDIRKERLPVSTDIGKVCLPISADIRKERLPVTTDVIKECLQNECAVKADVASLENSTEVKISCEEKAPSTEEEPKNVRQETVESDRKVAVCLEVDEISRCKTDTDVKDIQVISADIEENDNIQVVTNTSDKEATDTSKLDDHIVSSGVQVDEANKEVPNTNKDLTEGVSGAEMGKPRDVEMEDEKLQTNQLISGASDLPKAEKETKLELPKKKFFKHREPGQMRNKRFTCIFNIEEDEKELLESVTKSEKCAATSALEGPIRDTEQYHMYGKRSLDMTVIESPIENVDRPLQVESHMLDIGINLPDIPDMTFIAPSERKWPLAAKEMKCYVGKRRRLLDDAEEEEEEAEEEVKEEPQEELDFQSSRWPETTRKRCYPGKRTPKFSQEYHPCSFLQKRSPERSSLRSYGKSKMVDSPESGADKTLLQFKQGSPKILSKYAAMEDKRQQKRSNVNPSFDASDDEGKLEGQVSTLSVKGCGRMQLQDSRLGKKEAEQRFNLPPHVLGRNIGDPASDPTERKSPLQQPRIGVRVPYRNLTSQIVSSQEIVREILERSRVRSTAIAMAMNKRVADAVDRSFSKRLNASLARLPMASGPEELEAALQASAGTKLKLLPQDKEHNWHVGLPGIIGSSATTTVTTIKSSPSYGGSKSGARSRSSTRGAEGSGLCLDKESEREIALRQLETLPSRCRSRRRQTESASAVKVTKPKKLDWCKQRSRRKQSK